MSIPIMKSGDKSFTFATTISSLSTEVSISGAFDVIVVHTEPSSLPSASLSWATT